MTKQPGSKPLDFELFRKTYKPHVRPEGLLSRVTDVFQMDAKFSTQHGYLRKFLLADRVNWAEDIVEHLTKVKGFSEDIDAMDLEVLRGLFQSHAVLFRAGAYSEDYFSSIEDISLFFINQKIDSLVLAGAYRGLSLRLIALIIERASNNRSIPLDKTIQALTSALLIEVNQIQRTYTMYEQHVSKSLVSDLSKSKFMKDIQTETGTTSPAEIEEEHIHAE